MDRSMKKAPQSGDPVWNSPVLTAMHMTAAKATEIWKATRSCSGTSGPAAAQSIVTAASMKAEYRMHGGTILVGPSAIRSFLQSLE